MIFDIKATISNNIRELIQANNYEEIICDILNSSNIIFPHTYIRNTEQSHGECDFIDLETRQKYDAKILFKTEQCKMIANNELINWIRSMRKEELEFNNKVNLHKVDEINKTSLFFEMEARLQKVESDEHAIFFLPYPIVFEFTGNIYTQFAEDILSMAYKAVKAKHSDKLNDKKVYIVYPSMNKDTVVIRELSGSSKNRETISTNKFSKYISYSWN